MQLDCIRAIVQFVESEMRVPELNSQEKVSEVIQLSLNFDSDVLAP